MLKKVICLIALSFTSCGFEKDRSVSDQRTSENKSDDQTTDNTVDWSSLRRETQKIVLEIKSTDRYIDSLSKQLATTRFHFEDEDEISLYHSNLRSLMVFGVLSEKLISEMGELESVENHVKELILYKTDRIGRAINSFEWHISNIQDSMSFESSINLDTQRLESLKSNLSKLKWQIINNREAIYNAN